MKINQFLLAFLLLSGVFLSANSTSLDELVNKKVVISPSAAVLPDAKAQVAAGLHDQDSKAGQIAKQQDSVNINQATVQALMQLKGIGVRKAEAIVSYRDNHGKFQSVDELARVKGMSKRIIEENRSKMSL